MYFELSILKGSTWDLLHQGRLHPYESKEQYVFQCFVLFYAFYALVTFLWKYMWQWLYHKHLIQLLALAKMGNGIHIGLATGVYRSYGFLWISSICVTLPMVAKKSRHSVVLGETVNVFVANSAQKNWALPTSFKSISKTNSVENYYHFK
jgi:hypothetical protein